VAVRRIVATSIPLYSSMSGGNNIKLPTTTILSSRTEQSANLQTQWLEQLLYHANTFPIIATSHTTRKIPSKSATKAVFTKLSSGLDQKVAKDLKYINTRSTALKLTSYRQQTEPFHQVQSAQSTQLLNSRNLPLQNHQDDALHDPTNPPTPRGRRRTRRS
jgi:hypothetical protein